MSRYGFGCRPNPISNNSNFIDSTYAPLPWKKVYRMRMTCSLCHERLVLEQCSRYPEPFRNNSTWVRRWRAYEPEELVRREKLSSQSHIFSGTSLEKGWSPPNENILGKFLSENLANMHPHSPSWVHTHTHTHKHTNTPALASPPPPTYRPK